MNLISRSVTKVLSSSLNHSRAANLPTRKWVLSRLITSGGESEAPEKEVAPPKTIKYREELENSVNLIGVVDQNVQFDSPSDGKFWAGTVISHHSESMHSTLRVPIIFEGDLAKTAVQHLKKNDRIHVSGTLFQTETFPKSNLQIMAQSFNLVQDMNVDVTVRQHNYESWNDLAQNPHKWSHKTNPKVPDFKHMETGETLWMRDAPTWVQSKLPPLKKKDEKPATD